MPPSDQPQSGPPDSAVPADAGPPPSEPLPSSYEEAVAELDHIVSRIEGGRLPLEESLASFQRGVALVSYCRAQLARVEQRVNVLEGDLLTPFEPDTDANMPADVPTAPRARPGSR